MDYWRKTPLQCDIEGAAFVQTIVFGMLGIRIARDFAVTFAPSLLDGVNYLHVKNLRLCGRNYDVTVERDGQGRIKVRCS